MIAFVLSAGRSGSTTVQFYLKIAENAVVMHEPPGTQCVITAIQQGRMENWPVSRADIFEWTRREGIDQVVAGGKHYIECTPILASLFDGIIKIYPQAKIIWLYRDDPRLWIRSAMHTGFAHCNFKDCCWYWWIQNMEIFRGWKKVPRANRTILKSSEIHKQIRRLYDWLELQPHNATVARWLAVDHRGHKYRGPLWCPHPDDWGEEEYRPYDKVIKPLFHKMEELYGKEAFAERDI